MWLAGQKLVDRYLTLTFDQAASVLFPPSAGMPRENSEKHMEGFGFNLKINVKQIRVIK